MNSLPDGQRMARVTISDEDWRAFRALAIQKKQSVASYLGHLVRREIGRAARVEHRRALRSRFAQPEADVKATWVPPWEI